MRNRHWLNKASSYLFVASAILLAANSAHASAELVLVPNPIELGALVLAFAVIILPLNALIFRPLLDVFEAREEKIAGANQKAAETAERAQELLARYEESIRDSREEISNERKKAVRAARLEEEALTNSERASADVALAAARDELASSIESIRVELRDSARNLGRAAATRIMGREL
ncbi:MAG: ATP synthase F0 subunit B [Deltaproteobacteria bacterium]|nr:ATP synthase F0 subunit B [Deltaproteobacteria bacterium]